MSEIGNGICLSVSNKEYRWYGFIISCSRRRWVTVEGESGVSLVSVTGGGAEFDLKRLM